MWFWVASLGSDCFTDVNIMWFWHDLKLSCLSWIWFLYYIHFILLALGQDINLLMSTSRKTYPEKYGNCKDTSSITSPCVCHYHICVGWYPCGLKYCRGKDSAGRYVSYRCGIKTCRRFISYDFVVDKKHNCLWDDI